MADLLRWETRKIRKPHYCWGCGEIYPVGEKMSYAAYADGGSVSACYWCETCEEYMKRHLRGEEIDYGEIYENDREGWEQLKAELEAAKAEEGENQ